MSSMFKAASDFSITGRNTFTVIDNSLHHHGIRESSNILYREVATAAFHNSKERFDPPKCHPNTRLAVLSEIMKWIKWEGDLNSFIIWVYGPAGAGKSAIAQTIAEMCEEEMILLASFFFSRNDSSRNTVKPLIATIAYQITFNLPDVRDAILGAVERDPLVFSKSLIVQLKSLIVEPLQQLIEAGFFNQPTSRRLVIIDGLDECSDPKVQRNIVEILANAHRQHRLPLTFLFASRPEQHISLAFSTGLLPSVTTRIVLDESYIPDKDIALFLTDKFQEIKSTHRLRAYIPPQWPSPDVLEQLVKKSSGQFIYASTVINYVSSIRHKPCDRLDIVLGIRPPQKDLPFAELDALYMHILAGVEDVDSVLEILSFKICSRHTTHHGLAKIEEFLSLQPGDIELYLGDLNSLLNVGVDYYQPIRFLHASLTDFLTDPTRSKEFWINLPARHTAIARRCLQLLQFKESVEVPEYAYYNTIYHCENAEVTPALRDDLIQFSFGDLQHSLSSQPDDILFFLPDFLSGLKSLVWPLAAEAVHISQALQIDFDKMLRNTLLKHHSFPGFALLLGGLLRYTNAGQDDTFLREIIVSLSLGRQRGEGYIFDDIGLAGLEQFAAYRVGTPEFLTYFAEFLGDPERSQAYVFDQQRYTTASKECLQLCLCNHHKFSKGVVAPAYRDNVLRKSRPSVWIKRFGVYRRIRKGRHSLKVRRWKLLKSNISILQKISFPRDCPEHKYYQSLSYRWSLDLLPSFLERSAISMELAEVLHRCTFTTMAQKFPRRMRLAKDAIAKYLLRVESHMGDP